MNIFKNLNFSPLQLISAGFVIIILIGTVLLMLPVSASNNASQNFIDALFTATSAVSTTGLIVVDTGSYYTLFGQIVILILIQIGGLGYMVLFVLISLIIRSNLSITGKKFLRESVSRLPTIDIIKFVKRTVLYTVIFEITGTIFYAIVLMKNLDPLSATYSAFFHSISAFCTAGFSLFSNSFSDYGTNWLTNINTYLLVLGGSIGFFTLYDISTYIKKTINRAAIKKFATHTKIVLTTSFTFYILGTIILLILEGNKFSDNFLNKIFYSFFQTITASTTVGFNTIDIGMLSNASLFVLILLMFIGGSPGSTAGGIKTTNFVIFSKFAIASLSQKKDVSIFKRTINNAIFQKVTAQIFVAVVSLSLFTFLLVITEQKEFLKILFEAVSAFGTVGLSTGITSELTTGGKLSIIALMLIGRIGPLVIGLSLIPKSKSNNYVYPEEEILIT